MAELGMMLLRWVRDGGARQMLLIEDGLDGEGKADVRKGERPT